MKRESALASWLERIEQLHPSEIELGLERTALVAGRLGIARPDATVFTVAGTNGKGSCVTAIEHLLIASGQRVGAYTSPHLCRYNERVRIAGSSVDDEALCAAFARVDAARGDVKLTYFEFGTLAALLLFHEARLDCLVLEVGLGGRLDAVNIIDTDVAVVTSIQLDHTEWLGTDRESIAREKAGIFRRDRPAVCADREPPQSLQAVADERGARWYGIGAEFDCGVAGGSWYWRGCDSRGAPIAHEGMAMPVLLQSNVAAALQALALVDLLPERALLEREISRIRLPGRFQKVLFRGIECVLDVAHNPAGVQMLAAQLSQAPATPRTALVFAAMRDKDVESMLVALQPMIDRWFMVQLAHNPRAVQAAALSGLLEARFPGSSVSEHGSVEAALNAAINQLNAGDRLLVCGSFHVVGPALQWLEDNGVSTGVMA